MPRRARVFVPGLSVHVIHRGNNRTAMFSDDEDCETYLTMLRTFSEAENVAVHGFALMRTHDHLLVTPSSEIALPRAMRRVGGSYVRYFNRKHGRIGTLLNERYKGLIVANENYWLLCLRYIEQNPVRAGIVPEPAAYRWSSHRVHVGLEKNDWIQPHPVFEALGKELTYRYSVYKAICAAPLTHAELIAQRLGTEEGRSHLRPSSVPNSAGAALTASGIGMTAP
jgi:REP-associated tyrosine transposase